MYGMTPSRRNAILALIAAGIVVYSETVSFVWDEGLHILAAQLIDRGEKPYLDFCFPETPLNAYWNALWMGLLGQSWHVTHLIAGLEVGGATVLISHYVFRRFPVPSWRFALALTVACFVGLNSVIVQFGTVSQAYGIGLFLTVAAFRAAIAAVDRKGPLLSLTAGLLIGDAGTPGVLGQARRTAG